MPVDLSGILNVPGPKTPVEWNTRDLLIYAVGLGITDLKYVYELDPNYQPFPTYPLVIGSKGASYDVNDFGKRAGFPKIEGINIDLNKLLHGEQAIEVVNPLPRSGKGYVQSKYVGIYDVGKAAIFENETTFTHEDGTVLAKLTGASFIRDAGGWGGPRPPQRELKKPERAPDYVDVVKTGELQAQLYRLSGDYNPLHVDPAIAKSVGFKAPILHGLCSYGTAARGIVKHLCGDDASRFVSMRSRFTSPVIPGETLETRMWKVKEENGLITAAYETVCKETGKAVISGGTAVVRSAPGPKL
ncbi:MaoC-like dehydratase [Hyaloraphidium curvatum]|nr:MaoC-like dehydratase [Hyaloraphidium curvatum]